MNTNITLKHGDQLTVTVAPDTVTPPPPTNQLPLVAAGADKNIKLPVSEVTLTGAVSDPDGTVTKIAWTKLSTLAGTIVSPALATTKITGLVVGTHTFRLTATDDKGGIAADDIKVIVAPADVIVIPPPTGTVNYMALPLSGALDLSGKSNMVVENKRFTNINGIAIKLYSGANNITIRNCFFDGATMELVELENASNITIENCLFARAWAGVYAVGSNNTKVINCQFVNMKAKYVDGNFSGRGVFVQFNSCNGGEVTNCKGESFPGESDPEDLVSCYGSSSNIRISGNMFRGGGPSGSGGGIIMGDNGGNNIIAENNSLMDPGQYGIAIAGGTNMKILNNKIFAKQQSFSNNPLYVWAQAGAGGRDATVKGNRVNWTDRDGNKNNGWNSGNIPNTIWEEPTTITEAEMGFPAHLITFITPAELLTIRK